MGDAKTYTEDELKAAVAAALEEALRGVDNYLMVKTQLEVEHIVNAKAEIAKLITPEASAALERAIKAAEIRGQVKAGGVFVTSDAEACWCEHVESACPCCGGSGHKDDAAAALTKVLDDAEAKGMQKAAGIARLAMVNDPDADELTCSICAAAIRAAIQPAARGEGGE